MWQVNVIYAALWTIPGLWCRACLHMFGRYSPDILFWALALITYISLYLLLVLVPKYGLAGFKMLAGTDPQLYKDGMITSSIIVRAGALFTCVFGCILSTVMSNTEDGPTQGYLLVAIAIIMLLGDLLWLIGMVAGWIALCSKPAAGASKADEEAGLAAAAPAPAGYGYGAAPILSAPPPMAQP